MFWQKCEKMAEHMAIQEIMPNVLYVTYLVETEKLGKKKLHSSSSWDSSSGDAAV